VASFSSHIHRLQQICDIAHDTGRKVVVTGRSMLTNTRVARDLGYLHVSGDDIIDAYDLDDFPSERIVVLCTGSQGEPLSALARMARGEHRSLSINENDTVIISATPVPGNEKSVQSIINSLAKIGCEVYDRNNAHVHVSGHGSQEELKLMLAMTSPKYFMPVHGEALHLRAHAALARTMGWDSQHIFVLDNGDSLEVREGRGRRGAAVESGTVYVDGGLVGDTEPQVLRDRQRLSQDGIVSCVVAVNARSRKAEDVQISSRGVSFANDEDLKRELDTLVRKTVERDGQSRVPVESTRKDVRNALSNLLWAKTHTRPMVISVVMEV
jgi:ribonuclease J